MEKLKNYSGGRGYYVEDVESLQNQISAFVDYLYRPPNSDGAGSETESIAKVFDFVLGGCDVSGNTIAPGLVYVAQTLIQTPQFTASQFPCWMVFSSVDDHGQQRYYDLDAVSKYAFQKTQASLVYTQPGGNSIRFNADGPELRFFDFVRKLMWQHTSEWKSLTLKNGWTGSAEYYISREGFLYLRGRVYSAGATDETILTLPPIINNNIQYRLDKFAVPTNVDGFVSFDGASGDLNVDSFDPVQGYIPDVTFPLSPVACLGNLSLIPLSL